MYLALIEIRTDNISGDRHRMSDNETLNELCIKQSDKKIGCIIFFRWLSSLVTIVSIVNI